MSSIFTGEQKWIIDNLINLLENQKTEIHLLTGRVTKLEILKVKKWQGEGEKTVDGQKAKPSSLEVDADGK